MAQYFEVHPVQPQVRLLKQAADILAKGGIAAIPTDSSYALVCRLDDKAAVDALADKLDRVVMRYKTRQQGPRATAKRLDSGGLQLAQVSA